MNPKSRTDYGRYGKPVDLGHEIYWVGYYDKQAHVHCNPYLIKAGDRAVLLDGGSRSDFPVVMLKILQTGVEPAKLDSLIYQHYDPDLCGSLPNFIDLCDNPEIQVLSARANNTFIAFYLHRESSARLVHIDDLSWELVLDDRTLRFIHTPFAHSAGSFVTYDTRSKILFSSDLFGSFATHWDLCLRFDPACYTCTNYLECPEGKAYCPVPDILQFHQQVMPNGKALALAMRRIGELEIAAIAPQHGAILREQRDIQHLIELLSNLEGVGIDGVK